MGHSHGNIHVYGGTDPQSALGELSAAVREWVHRDPFEEVQPSGRLGTGGSGRPGIPASEPGPDRAVLLVPAGDWWAVHGAEAGDGPLAAYLSTRLRRPAMTCHVWEGSLLTLQLFSEGRW